MRMMLAAIPAMLALATLTTVPAAARTGGDHWQDRFEDDSAAHRRGEKRSKTARATIGDADGEYYEEQRARPKRAHRADRRVHRLRHAKRSHASSKRARRAVHKGRRHAHRPGRRTTLVRLPVVPTRGQARPIGSAQSGVASYYWQGQRVASGGWFNPEGMTAAHRSLPFGTRVRVTHLANGRSVQVRINDRGPYIAGRIIDLSRGAARVIGMTGRGIAQVRVTILGR